MASTTNFNWSTPDDTSLVKDGAAAIRTLGQSIDTSMAELKGGTTGQVLSKTSNTDMDFTWVAQDDSNAIQNAIVDAKGDLIAATANDTPARLAVGTNGQVLTADSTAATGLAWATPSAGSSNVAGKNGVLNSNFSIWQRGTSVACSSTAYAADRWQAYRTVAGATVSRQVTNDTTNLPFIQYCARVQRDSGNTSTTAIFLGQSFETVNSIPYVGKTVTISFYARAGANYSSASSGLTVYVSSGTGTDQNVLTSYTGANNFINQTATLTTTWQRFSYSGTVPTTATELGTYIFYTPVGTAGANDYYEITGVQIEIASSASAYSPATPTQQAELAACQRYFQKIGGEANMAMATGGATGTGAGNLFVRFPVVFRTAPSFAYGGTLSTDYLILTAAGGSAGAPTSLTQGVAGTTSSRVDFSGVSGLTAGYVTGVQCSNTNANLQFSAEL